ncbi:hypothetical protein DDD64_04625 [Actinotignum sanguinis]|uniref:HNH endonuclease n=1 Tax=Actinotignum sanguinis TaxID=1445614 RepID=UPI000F7F5B38|nr:HNH endonuclease [Actinotignum sanguinis]MDY5148296.1 HNH endonuclease [Actinotignum sanguinis]RTE49947.1 hypothetical protein DDD64_04625 [Actinotignum sanguinis]
MLASEYAALIAQDTGTRRERFNGAKPRGNGGATSQHAFETFMTYPDFPKSMGILCAYLELTGGYNGPIQNLAISALPERGGAYMGFVASAGLEEQLLTVFNSEGQLQSWKVSLRIDGDIEIELAKELEELQNEEYFELEYGEVPYKSEALFLYSEDFESFDFLLHSPLLSTGVVEQFDYMHSVIGYRKRRMQWHNPYLWEYLGKWLNDTPAAIPSTERPGRDHLQSLVSDPVDEWLNEHGDDIVESEFDVTEISEKILRWVRERPTQQQFRKKLLETRKTCEVCGMDRPEILEAAHIVPKHLDSPDSSSNGLLLCRNHHRAFDIGWLQYDATTKSLQWNNDCHPF